MTREDEIRLAAFMARPGYGDIRPLLEELAPGVVAAIDAIVRKIRVEVWRDLTAPADH